MLRDNAKVSVFDSGFLLGDGIWEGLRLNKKKWVFFEDHINRLFEALKLVEIKFKLSKDQILQELEKTSNSYWKFYFDFSSLIISTFKTNIRSFLILVNLYS